MLVEVEALDAFVHILGDGDMVSATRGDKVLLPKASADRLATCEPPLVRLLEVPRAAPQDKAAGPSPEVKKAPRKRAAAKAPANPEA